MGRNLNNEEWILVAKFTDDWIKELGALKGSGQRSPTHKTIHWKKRAKHRSSTQKSSGDIDCVPTVKATLHPSKPRSHHRPNKKQQARDIQKFNRSNRKKCVRSILGTSSQYCNIETAKLEDHFNSSCPPHNLLSVLEWIPSRSPQADEHPDELSYPISKQELLACWCIDNEVISPKQKGFLPYEGCFEHSFLMQAALKDSKRRCKDLRIVWFDLKDAFGSISHYLLLDMLRRLNIPSDFIDVCDDIYTGSSYRVKSSKGLTNPIPLIRGVKQGCPLSPLLLNLVVQGLLAGLDTVDGGYMFNSHLCLNFLAYADDLCILGNSEEEIQKMICEIEKFCKWAQLVFNVDKCAALFIFNSRPKKFVKTFSPLVQLLIN